MIHPFHTEYMYICFHGNRAEHQEQEQSKLSQWTHPDQMSLLTKKTSSDCDKFVQCNMFREHFPSSFHGLLAETETSICFLKLSKDMKFDASILVDCSHDKIHPVIGK